MNNAILIQQAWIGDFGVGDYLPLLRLTKERNAAYCEQHNFDYIAMEGTEGLKYTDVLKGCWTKIELIQRALAQGYQYIVWLDPDALIKDLDTDLRDGCIKGVGACWHRIPQLNHWNTGVLFVQNTPDTVKFIDEWFASYPGQPQWMEQGEFNRLAMRSKTVQTISDRWNATLNYSIVPDAVILGYHGNGSAQQRLNMRISTLESAKCE
jgi:hypothetical protein